MQAHSCVKVEKSWGARGRVGAQGRAAGARAPARPVHACQSAQMCFSLSALATIRCACRTFHLRPDLLRSRVGALQQHGCERGGLDVICSRI